MRVLLTLLTFVILTVLILTLILQRRLGCDCCQRLLPAEPTAAWRYATPGRSGGTPRGGPAEGNFA